MKDFSLQSKIYLATNVNGKPQAMRWTGDALLKVNPSSSEESRKESYSGQRRTSATLNTGTEVSGTITFHTGSPENFAISLGGDVIDIASGSVTGEAFPTDLVAGELIALDHADISSLVINDSAGTPATLTEGTDYSIESAAGGMVKILDPASYTQPFTADYDYAARKDIVMSSQRSVVRYLVAIAENTVDGAEDNARLDLYRVKFNNVNELDLTATSLSGLEVPFTLLNDSNNESDSELGGYGRWIMPGTGA
jgi:hypothetical protein